MGGEVSAYGFGYRRERTVQESNVVPDPDDARKENGARHWLFDNLFFPRTALKTKKPPDLSATAAAKAIRTAKWATGLLHRCAAVQKFKCSR